MALTWTGWPHTRGRGSSSCSLCGTHSGESCTFLYPRSLPSTVSPFQANPGKGEGVSKENRGKETIVHTKVWILYIYRKPRYIYKRNNLEILITMQSIVRIDIKEVITNINAEN